MFSACVAVPAACGCHPVCGYYFPIVTTPHTHIDQQLIIKIYWSLATGDGERAFDLRADLRCRVGLALGDRPRRPALAAAVDAAIQGCRWRLIRGA